MHAIGSSLLHRDLISSKVAANPFSLTAGEAAAAEASANTTQILKKAMVPTGFTDYRQLILTGTRPVFLFRLSRK